MEKRVALVSCVKSKRPRISAASDLYTSALFRGMRGYAEQYTDSWYILSEKYGVLAPGCYGQTNSDTAQLLGAFCQLSAVAALATYPKSYPQRRPQVAGTSKRIRAP